MILLSGVEDWFHSLFPPDSVANTPDNVTSIQLSVEPGEITWSNFRPVNGTPESFKILTNKTDQTLTQILRVWQVSKL